MRTGPRIILATLLTGVLLTASTTAQVEPFAAEAVPIICNTSVTGTFTSSDNVWFGICSDGQAYLGPVKTYDLQGVAGTTITITYTSTDIFNDLVLVVLNPPDGTDSSCHRGGTFSYTLPTTGLYKIGAGGSSESVGGHYSLALSCVSGGTSNLVPYRPTAWSDKVLVQTAADSAAGSTLDSTAFTPADTLYLRWAVANSGTGATGAAFYVDIYLDGTAFSSHVYHYDQPLPPNYYVSWNPLRIGSLGPGSHTIRVVADSTNAVGETSETDNDYLKTIVVQGGGPSPTPTRTVTPTVPQVSTTPTRVPRMPMVLVGPRKGR